MKEPKLKGSPIWAEKSFNVSFSCDAAPGMLQ